MPYSGPDDKTLPDHVTALPEDKRRQWVAVWNETFKRCTSEGAGDCEAAAFKAANGAVKEAEVDEAFKTDGGAQYPAEAYAYVPDRDKPSTWKIRLWESPTAKITKAQLGRAAAAFSPGGFRGQKVQIPAGDVGRVKARIRAAYRSLGVAASGMPASIRESDPPQRFKHVDVIPLSEADYDPGKGELTIRVIRPGFNKAKTRFYPVETLRRDHKVLEALKMFRNHPSKSQQRDRPERDVNDWVGQVAETWPEDDGAVAARAKVHDRMFRQKLADLKESGLLKEMGISIVAIAEQVRSKVEGVATDVVERLVAGRSVDFVTYAGAGGQVEFYESEDDPNDIDLVDEQALRDRRPDLVEIVEAQAVNRYQADEGRSRKGRATEMEETIEQLEKELKTTREAHDADKAKVAELEKGLAEAREKGARVDLKTKVEEALAGDVGKDLPDPAKNRVRSHFEAIADPLAILENVDDRITKAVKAERDYLNELKGSAKVRNLGGDSADGDDPRQRIYEKHKAELISQGAAEAEADERARDWARL